MYKRAVKQQTQQTENSWLSGKAMVKCRITRRTASVTVAIVEMKKTILVTEKKWKRNAA